MLSKPEEIIKEKKMRSYIRNKMYSLSFLFIIKVS